MALRKLLGNRKVRHGNPKGPLKIVNSDISARRVEQRMIQKIPSALLLFFRVDSQTSTEVWRGRARGYADMGHSDAPMSLLEIMDIL